MEKASFNLDLGYRSGSGALCEEQNPGAYRGRPPDKMGYLSSFYPYFALSLLIILFTRSAILPSLLNDENFKFNYEIFLYFDDYRCYLSLSALFQTSFRLKYFKITCRKMSTIYKNKSSFDKKYFILQ